MPDKADRKRSVVKLSVNEAGLEMIKSGCQSPARTSSVPALVIRGYLRRMARGGTCEDPKMAKNEDTDVWKFPCSAPRERSRSL